jgi:hypothetical protein
MFMFQCHIDLFLDYSVMLALCAQIIFESTHTKADVAAVKHSLGVVREMRR